MNNGRGHSEWLGQLKMFPSNKKRNHICITYKNEYLIFSGVGSRIRIGYSGCEFIPIKNGKEPMKILGIDII